MQIKWVLYNCSVTVGCSSHPQSKKVHKNCKNNQFNNKTTVSAWIAFMLFGKKKA